MNQQAWCACAVVLAVGVSSSRIDAHPGTRIWVGVVDGKVTTYSGPYPPGEPDDYEVSSVFTQPLDDEGGGVWTTDFPGFQKVPGGSIPAETTFRYDIVGPLLWYNAGDETRCPFFEPVGDHFADAPLVPQMAITNELFQTRYTSTGFVAGDATYTYHGGDGDHNHLTYTLLGDGQNPVAGPDGIYVLQLRLTADGYEPSETFALMLGKNASTEELDASAWLWNHPFIGPDLECDGDVDIDDFGLFYQCCPGPGASDQPHGPDNPHCSRADFDLDGFVDLIDFGLFQRCAGERDVPSDPGCLP